MSRIQPRRVSRLRGDRSGFEPFDGISPVGVLKRILVFETRTGGVHTARISTVLVLLLEDARQVAAAKLGIPLAVPQVVTTLEADDVDVAHFIHDFKGLDSAVATIRARHDDARFLIREHLFNLCLEPFVHGLHVHLFTLLAVVLARCVDQGAHLKSLIGLREVTHEVNLTVRAHVQNRVPTGDEQDHAFERIRDASFGKIREHLVDDLITETVVRFLIDTTIHARRRTRHRARRTRRLRGHSGAHRWASRHRHRKRRHCMYSVCRVLCEGVRSAR
mmetsp:Transcript_821/g.2531  ORF Transcript_821/g.2531 Transcript_821/m.2531 type:complete len:276 (+) Transcript_821:100-927(+)